MIWINLGRVVMLFIWGVLLFNWMTPFPKPLHYFLSVALIFMFLMHGLQVLLFKATLNQTEQKLTAKQQLCLFLFGSVELLAWRRKKVAGLDKR